MKRYENNRECFKRIGMMVIGMILLLGVWGNSLTIRAAKDSGVQSGTEADSDEGMIKASVMVALEPTQAREQPDESAAVVVEISEGQTVLSIGETENGWCEVFYQEKKVYIPAAALSTQELDQEALDKEMQVIEEEGKAYIESLEMQRKALKQEKIWSLIIIILVVSVFAVGIVSVLNSSRKNRV